MSGFVGSVLGSCRRDNEIKEYVNRTHTENQLLTECPVPLFDYNCIHPTHYIDIEFERDFNTIFNKGLLEHGLFHNHKSLYQMYVLFFDFNNMSKELEDIHSFYLKCCALMQVHYLTESLETMITHNKSFLRDKVENYFKNFVEIDQDDFSYLTYVSMIAYRIDNK